MPITQKLIRGSIWNSLSQFGSQGLNLAITVLLARLLAPEDFGLFGMVIIVTSFVGFFSEFGMTAGLIQKQDVDDLDTNSLFWTTVGFAVFLYATMYFLAPLVAVFFNEPQITQITRVVFINFLVMPLNFIPEALETKNLSYGKISIAELASVVISGAATIAMALAGLGVWSLVWQNIIKTASRGLILSAATGWWPKLLFSIKRMKPLLLFGVDLTINNLLLYAAENTDYLLVGKLLGKNPLGLYTMAFRTSKYPVLKLEGIFTKMLFPAFSTFRDDHERVKKNYLRLLSFFLTWTTPALCFGYFAADPLIRILLGDKWLEIIPLVQVFMLYLVFTSFCVQNNPIMIAVGRLKTLNAVQLISTLALLCFGFAGIKLFGLMGMAWAYTIVTSASLVAVFILLTRAIAVPAGEILGAVRAQLFKNLAGVAALGLTAQAAFRLSDSAWIRLGVEAAALLAWLLIGNRKDLAKIIDRLKIHRADEGKA